MLSLNFSSGEPNESYSPADGVKYILCYRCGITGEVDAESEQEFCRDCNHRWFTSVFRKLDYSKILKRSEAA